MHPLLTLALVALLLMAPSARAGTVGEDIAARAAVDAVHSREATAMDATTVPYPDGVTALPGRVYATLRGYRPLTLDLYLPPERFAGPRPVIFVIHGGGWIYGNPRHEAAFADWPHTLAEMAGQGYVVAAVSYRLGSEAPFPAALRDLKAAVRWLRAHAADYRIDKVRFVSWGGSAGGQLSAMLATTCGLARFEPELGDGFGANLTPPPISAGGMPESDCVQGAVGWYGAYDFTRPIGGPLPLEHHPYFPCKATPCPRVVLEEASAAFFVDARDPPILLVHGAGDKSAPLSQSQHFLEILRAKSVPARLEVIPGVDHGWIGGTPEETRKASRHALALSLDFTEAVIGDRKSGR